MHRIPMATNREDLEPDKTVLLGEGDFDDGSSLPSGARHSCLHPIFVCFIPSQTKKDDDNEDREVLIIALRISATAIIK